MSIQPLSGNMPTTYGIQTSGNPTSRAPEQVKSSSPGKAAGEAAAEAKKLNPQEQIEALQDASRKANQAVAGLRSDLQFSVDDSTGSNVVRVVDTKTKEVIRQIPAQEMLVIAKRLDELQGLLIKEQA